MVARSRFSLIVLALGMFLTQATGARVTHASRLVHPTRTSVYAEDVDHAFGAAVPNLSFRVAASLPRSIVEAPPLHDFLLSLFTPLFLSHCSQLI